MNFEEFYVVIVWIRLFVHMSLFFYKESSRCINKAKILSQNLRWLNFLKLIYP